MIIIIVAVVVVVVIISKLPLQLIAFEHMHNMTDLISKQCLL